MPWLKCISGIEENISETDTPFLCSFLLDLQTDECDCGFIIEKPEKETVDSKLKKAFTPMKKSKPKGVMDGVPLTQEGVCQVLLENVWRIL